LKLKTAAIAVLALVIGLMVGWSGIGLGALTSIMLFVLFGLSPQKVRAGSIFLMFTASIPALFVYNAAGVLHWNTAIMAAVGAFIGAIVGAKLSSGRDLVLLRRVLCILLLAAGAVIVVVGKFGAEPSLNRLQTFGAGAAAGLLGGVAGIGSGMLLVPILVIWLDMSITEAASVALFAVIPASLPGVIVNRINSVLDENTSWAIGLGAAAGGLIGALIATQIPSAVLLVCFGVFLALLAIITFAIG
jgi:uncharacterized membrane protein YfcA